MPTEDINCGDQSCNEPMAATAEPGNGASAPTAELDALPLVLRSYQAEMVEESLRSNIIVVMDTGSGKTHMFVEIP